MAAIFPKHISFLSFLGILFLIPSILLSCQQEPIDDTPDVIVPSIYLLSYEAGPGGSLTGQTQISVAEGEKGDVVKAIPDPGYVFIGWSDGLEAAERWDVATKDFSVIAHFARQYTVTVLSDIPGACLFQGNTLQTVREGDSSTKITAIPAKGYRFDHWSDGVTTAEHPPFTPTEDTILYAIVEEIPAVSTLYIQTDDQKGITSKTDYKSASLSVDADIEHYVERNLGCQIRGHGNSSWTNFRYTKPSYRLKLDEKNHLLGIGSGEARDYVLVSNHADATQLRNYTVLSFGQMLSGISYVPSSKFVHLYINDEYRGLYQLCEKIKTGSHRVDIDDSGDEADIGYLLELDHRAGQSENDVYITISNIPIAIKSDGTSATQIAFIKDYLTRFHTAVLSGNREQIEELADLSSIIDLFILEEFSKDRDVGFASFYLIKEPGGKLYFSCPWDFDLSLGNDSMFRHPTNLVTNSDSANPWFAALLKQSWFQQEITARLTEIKPFFDLLISETAAMGKLLREPSKRNDEKWDIYGRRLLWEPDMVCYDLKDYDEHLQYLLNWMQRRASWLLDYFDVP